MVGQPSDRGRLKKNRIKFADCNPKREKNNNHSYNYNNKYAKYRVSRYATQLKRFECHNANLRHLSYNVTCGHMPHIVCGPVAGAW